MFLQVSAIKGLMIKRILSAMQNSHDPMNMSGCGLGCRERAGTAEAHRIAECGAPQMTAYLFKVEQARPSI